MQTFYPSIKTYAEHRLPVGEPHTLFIEECGNPDGIPIVVVHSGPGAGCEPFQRRFFDPELYRMILFDQRGAGRSTPHAELRNNTTPDLIEDIDKVRQYLNIDKWVVYGNSWGSALGILYAQRFPQNILGMVLSSIFLARKADIDWFYRAGANQIFPDYWEDFMSGLDEHEKENPLKTYCERLTGDDELARMATAKSWSLWQARCAALQPHAQIIDHFSDPHFAVGLARIESMYMNNGCFVIENEILDNLDKIKHIITYIIHGRYDMVCPLHGAWDLHRKWSASELYIIRDAGHSPREPGVIDATILATKKMAKFHSKLA